MEPSCLDSGFGVYYSWKVHGGSEVLGGVVLDGFEEVEDSAAGFNLNWALNEQEEEV